MKKDIVLFGIQGSGKGTQADLLLKKLPEYRYFEPGNILRALKSNDNILGEHIRDSINEGKMVDDAVVFGVFDIYGHLINPGEYMLVDGFLRTENQLHYFLTQMYIYKRDFVGIYFDFPKERAIERLLARAKKEGREDDNIKSIETRLSLYEKETMPVIEFLKKKGKLIVVDARGSIEEVFADMMSKLQEKGLL